MKPPNVIIYHDELLPTTSGFVLYQGEALADDYRAIYAGSRLNDAIHVPSDRRVVINKGTRFGRAQEIFFKLTRRPPMNFIGDLRAYRPRLVHAHFGLDATLILPTARRMGVPLVTTFHGYDVNLHTEHATTVPLKLYMRRRDELRRYGSLSIAVSEFIRRRLIHHGFDGEKIVVHYIGVDCDRFRPDPYQRREPILLFVGRFSPEKGCDHFLRAAAHAARHVPDLRVVMIGDGPLRPEIERMAVEQRVNVEFLGRRSHDEIRAWMQRSRVLCVPSVVSESGEEEAFGLVFIEAQASELPVVGFAVGGVPEAIAHGETGFVAAPGDGATLAKYVVELFDNEQIWQRFSRAGRERTVRLFNLHDQSRDLVRIYDDVLCRYR